jgi:hypothetical protein
MRVSIHATSTVVSDHIEIRTGCHVGVRLSPRKRDSGLGLFGDRDLVESRYHQTGRSHLSGSRPPCRQRLPNHRRRLRVPLPHPLQIPTIITHRRPM